MMRSHAGLFQTLLTGIFCLATWGCGPEPDDLGSSVSALTGEQAIRADKPIPFPEILEPPERCIPVATKDGTCDGVDDDCDGQTDEDYLPQASSCGVGACAATGQTTCVDGQENNACEPGVPVVHDVTCDGVDDDCDGDVDEDFAIQVITCGLGVCAAVGSAICVDGALQPSCTPGLPTGDETTCDGLDNDCDGHVDEDVSGAALKLTWFTISSNTAGEGLNVDGDTTTCTPGPGCADGVDNTLYVLAPLFNDPISDWLVDGAWMPLLDVTDLKTDGSTFELALRNGQLDPSNAGCDHQTQNCVYRASASVCSSENAFTDAKITAGVLTAGLVAPPTIQLPSFGTFSPPALYLAKLEASVTVSGANAVAIDGLLAGAVRRADLIAALQAVPDDALPVPKSLVVAFVAALLDDIDTDGDGTADACSVNFKISGIAATIAGAAL